MHNSSKSHYHGIPHFEWNCKYAIYPGYQIKDIVETWSHSCSGAAPPLLVSSPWLAYETFALAIRNNVNINNCMDFMVIFPGILPLWLMNMLRVNGSGLSQQTRKLGIVGNDECEVLPLLVRECCHDNFPTR
jgi:hypothetical protein